MRGLFHLTECTLSECLPCHMRRCTDYVAADCFAAGGVKLLSSSLDRFVHYLTSLKLYSTIMKQIGNRLR